MNMESKVTRVLSVRMSTAYLGLLRRLAKRRPKSISDLLKLAIIQFLADEA